MSCCEGIAKFVVVTINVILMLFGLACLVVGIVFKLGWDEVRDAFIDKADDVDFDLQSAGDLLSYAAIVIGAFIIVVTLLGICGACCKVTCLLVLYSVVVVCMLIGQVVVVALIYSRGDDARDDLSEGMKSSLKNYYENSTTDVSKAYSAIFNLLECCGVDNYTSDFTTDDPAYPFWPAPERNEALYGMNIPITCCRGVNYEDELTVDTFTDNSVCLLSPSDENAYTEGCLDSIEDWIDQNKQVLIGVGVTIFVIEVLLVILSCVLCRSDD